MARQDSVTASQMEDLIAAPVVEEEIAALEVEAQNLKNEKIPLQNVKASVLRRRLALLNTGAEPGPSGMRNGILVSVRKARNGVDSLRKWTSMWGSGCVQPSTTLLWTAGISIPLDCGPRPETQTGRKLPITLCECLPKFAEAVVQDEMAESIRTLFEPEQLGVSTPDGNIILLRALQNWSQEMEAANKERVANDDLNNLEAVVALDLTNAYGMCRSGAIAEMRESLPRLLGVVKSQWQNESNSFWMRVDGQWVRSETKRGGFQGLRFITVMFCLALKRSMREGTHSSGQNLAKPKYQDDSYLVGNLQVVVDMWSGLTSALLKKGHVLNLLKTEFWIPGCDDMPLSSLPENVGGFSSLVPRSTGGIKVMGCAAQGESEAVLGHLQMRLAPARDRLQKAKELLERVEDFLQGSPSPTSLHEAWCLVRFSAREALSYDIRAIPRAAIQPLLLEHANLMHRACEVLVGRPLSASSWARLQLPGPLGGMGLVLPLTSADAAYVATWQATGQFFNLLHAPSALL